MQDAADGNLGVCINAREIAVSATRALLLRLRWTNDGGPQGFRLGAAYVRQVVTRMSLGGLRFAATCREGAVMESLFGLLEKTDRGRQEVARRSGALDGRRRALLIMVDGRTSSKEILACAGELGLDASAVFQLLHVGFIQTVSEADGEPAVQSFSEVPPVSAKSKAVLQRRSLAIARMYLMDAMVRAFGTTDHPVRRRLIEATDPASVEAAFGEFLGVLQEIATPSMVGQIEESFRSLMPVGNQDRIWCAV